MTIAENIRRPLPMADHVRGKRSAVTCELKCANACLGPECNTSANQDFRSIASAVFSRRQLFGLGAAAAVAIAVGVDRAAPVSAPGAAGVGGLGVSTGKPGTAGLSFGPIASVPADVDAFTVPDGYTWQPLIRWGDPLFSRTPAFDILGQTAEAQQGQFGYNSDYLDIIPDPSGKTGVLVNNHEYVNPNLMFPATTDAAELQRRGEIYKAA